ncbi:hypothetical protein Y032_0272g926 [Ancylostoma ceylanicum]|uniref:Transportin-3 n=1 Tax=Ancylostoma ceylanicum TaxID=53326 RepID=A0A016S835_9BILA|nr:hypothetical protein Y032_0272g926 [Ancylostoma ceylanicum]
MGAEDASPSTRQAAVECVEQWVKLPGVGLQQWTPVLSVVFSAVSEDSAALTNLLNILAANDELSSTDQLVHDLCNYITTVVAQKLLTDLAEDIGCDELASLVSAICTVAVTAIPTLLRNARKSGSELLCDLCSLLANICSCDGSYPIDEMISDLPAQFFTTLRENIGSFASSSKYDENRNVATAVSSYYASVCRNAITKMSFPPAECFKEYDKVQREQFHRYRLARSEVSVDAYFMMGRDTLVFLNQELEEAIAKGNLCRIECVVFLWENVADYLSEEDYTEICQNLELCTRLSGIGEGTDADRLANTVMRHLHALSHLVQEHDNAAELECHVVRLVLPFIQRKGVSTEALRTLEKFVSERSKGILRVGDEISQCCYSFFMDEANSEQQRLEALKCIGYILSVKPSDDIMFENCHRLLVTRYQKLLYGERAFASVSFLLQVCDAVRSAVSNFPPEHLSEMLPLVSQLLCNALFTNPSAGCALAKTAVLIFGHNTSTTPQLCACIRQWLESFASSLPSQSIEEWLSLIYQASLLRLPCFGAGTSPSKFPLSRNCGNKLPKSMT